MSCHPGGDGRHEIQPNLPNHPNVLSALRNSLGPLTVLPLSMLMELPTSLRCMLDPVAGRIVEVVSMDEGMLFGSFFVKALKW